MADMLWSCRTADGRSKWLLWTEMQNHTTEYMHPNRPPCTLVHHAVSSGTHGELREQMRETHRMRGETPKDKA